MCGNLEKGYMLIIFIFAKLFRDYHYSLFFIQLLISIGIFAYAYKKRKNVSMIFIILVYLFLYKTLFSTKIFPFFKIIFVINSV